MLYETLKEIRESIDGLTHPENIREVVDEYLKAAEMQSIDLHNDLVSGKLDFYEQLETMLFGARETSDADPLENWSVPFSSPGDLTEDRIWLDAVVHAYGYMCKAHKTPMRKHFIVDGPRELWSVTSCITDDLRVEQTLYSPVIQTSFRNNPYSGAVYAIEDLRDEIEKDLREKGIVVLPVHSKERYIQWISDAVFGYRDEVPKNVPGELFAKVHVRDMHFDSYIAVRILPSDRGLFEKEGSKIEVMVKEGYEVHIPYLIATNRQEIVKILIGQIKAI